MKIIETPIPGVVIIEPTIFEDDRGYFFESYNQKKLTELGIDVDFVQDNQSKSQKNVLRGLHFQKPPYAQVKLVRVLQGAVLDIAVDIRKNSPYYGKYVSTLLSEQNKRMFYIPKGFAHGFLTLEDNTVFFYKCSNFYNKESEGTILWNDKNLNIDWGTEEPILSAKDKDGTPFHQFKTAFNF